MSCRTQVDALRCRNAPALFARFTERASPDAPVNLPRRSSIDGIAKSRITPTIDPESPHAFFGFRAVIV